MTTAIFSYIILARKAELEHAMAQAVIFRPFTSETRVLNWSTPSCICGSRRDTVACFYRSPSVFLWQYHSITIPHSFSYHHQRDVNLESTGSLNNTLERKYN